MKYHEGNLPIVCMMTQSACYKGTHKMEVKGVLWHSTGANNPTIKRYVQPDDAAPDREALLELLGKNQYNNDWNHQTSRKVGMNCFIGKLADGTVSTVQVMPWTFRPWGCGSGKNGSCNDHWIQFEICEDNLTNADYFNAAYREAVEITAYLCKMFNIDPMGEVAYNKLSVPTILCHADSHDLGLGSNHGDVNLWFKRYGKTMRDVRRDVAALLKEDAAVPSEPETENDTEAVIWNALQERIQNPFGTAGMMGNLYAESGLRSNNLQNKYEKSLSMTDEQYTEAVDDGSYADFVTDHAGYGLAQWTYHTRKQGLLDFAKEQGASIGDLRMQLGFLWKELESYKSVLNVLQNAKTVREASDVVLMNFERPADQSESVQEKRAEYGQRFYDKFSQATGSPPEGHQDVSDEPPATTLSKGSKGSGVAQMQSMLISLGYALPKYGADGSFGNETAKAVKQFQEKNGLPQTGEMDAVSYAALLKLYYEKPKEAVYTVTITDLDQITANEIVTLYGGTITVG